jgi:hypothetical protein
MKRLSKSTLNPTSVSYGNNLSTFAFNNIVITPPIL